jgi:hypothetical protein
VGDALVQQGRQMPAAAQPDDQQVAITEQGVGDTFRGQRHARRQGFADRHLGLDAAMKAGDGQFFSVSSHRR